MRKTFQAVTAAVFLLAGSSVMGALVAYDNFDYTLGTTVATGGTLGSGDTNGFSNAWKVSTLGGSAQVVGGLSFPGVASSGNALQFNHASGAYLFRGMSSTLPAGTYYMSMIFYRDDVNGTSGENWRWELKESPSYSNGPTSTTAVNAGSGSTEQASLTVAGGSAGTGTETYDVGSANFMLLKFTISDSGAETASMKWYKTGDAVPVTDSGIAWDATSSGSFSVAAGWRLTLNTGLPSLTIDEFRLGTDLVDVVPPGPSLLVYDNFDYPLGTMIDTNETLGSATNGFDNAWLFAGHTGEIVSNLVFSGVESSGNALKLTYNDAGYLFRGMSRSLTDGTYYMSCLFYRNDTDNGGSENWRWELKHAISHASGPGSSTKIFAGSTSGEQVQLQVDGDSFQTGSPTYNVGSPVLMLLKFTIDNSGSEMASMKWYNSGDAVPTNDVGIVWDAASTGEFSGGGGWKFTLPSLIGTMVIDEFRLGRALADVVPAGPVLGGYNLWSVIHALAEGPFGDDDSDGFANLYEYGLEGDPKNPLDQGIPPTFSLSDSGFLYIHPMLSDANSGILYHLETTADLVYPAWTNAGYAVIGTNTPGGTVNFVSNLVSTVSNDVQFIKLVIEQE